VHPGVIGSHVEILMDCQLAKTAPAYAFDRTVRSLPLARKSLMRMLATPKTLCRAIQWSGIGVHSGSEQTVRISPAPSSNGVYFVRTDQERCCHIPADFRWIHSTKFATSLAKDGVTVQTVEHLLAAIAGCGITSACIEVDGNEIPILDGSARMFFQTLQGATIDAPDWETSQPVIQVDTPISVHTSYGWAKLEPFDGVEFHATLDATDRFGAVFGRQSATWKLQHDSWDCILGARTFGRYIDGVEMQKHGFALGANLTNTVVFQEQALLNPEGFRYPNEMARHKILDAMGDLRLAGYPILGRFVGHNTGHSLHHALLQKLFTQSDCFHFLHPSRLRRETRS
jgi:UDP-3-O-[3-hydroxymyristoyl] N-acetylglucosamine deacetylase